MSDKKLQSYQSEFKESAVKLAIESSHPIARTAKELGFNVNTLHTWIGKYSKPKEGAMRTTEHHFDEIKQLKKELARVTQERKDILGFYVAESEGAHFWLGVLNDLHARGVEDILIACIDGLKGFPEAVNTLFPHTEIQLCIVHQIRNSLKYIASADLKTVYRAPSKETAEHNLLELDSKWGKKYPAVLASWQNNWGHLSSYSNIQLKSGA